MPSLIDQMTTIQERASTLRQRAPSGLENMLCRLQREAEQRGDEQSKRQRRAILRGWRSALWLLSERPLASRMARGDDADCWLMFLEDQLRAELFDEVMK